MNFKHIRNCLTCEFGFDNVKHDQDWNEILPEVLIIKCAGNTDLYGTEVSYKYCCQYWSVSLEEFTRARKKISYYDFYKDKLDLLENR